MKFILSTLYKGWVLLVFTVFMIILLPGIILPFLFGQRFGWISYRFLALWSWIFSKLNRILYTIIGRENIQKGKSYIYVSNHTSFLDIPGVTMAIPGQFRPLAKKELRKIPIFGWIASTAAIIVDRTSGQSRKESMDRLKKLVDMGISPLIFVEGTQNRSKELLQPFKDGAFRIAIDTQTPLLPIVIVGAGPLMSPGTVEMKPGRIKVIMGKEIPVEGLNTQDVAALKNKTMEAMRDLIVKHS